MQRFILISLLILMSALFLVDISVLPPAAKFLPELLSVFAMVYVIVAGVGQRFQFVPAKYWLVFGLIAIWLICSALANSVGTGPIVAGARTYLRAVPFFFLPAVFNFTEVQIRAQLKLLLVLSLVQVPLAIFQRYIILSERRFTGDPVYGTMMISSILSIFLICAVCILVGMLMRGRISKSVFATLFLVLLIPTMINETKATLLMMPLAVLVTFAIGSPPGKRARVVTTTISLIAVFGAIFIPVYDAMNVYSNRPSITTFFTEEGKIESTLSKDAEIGTTEYKGLGRVDAIVVPLRYLSKDPVHLLFGLGMGSASESALGPQFTGEYFRKFERFSFTSAADFLLELGVVGVVLVFLVYWLIYRDAVAVARIDSGIRSAIAVGWCGVTAVMVLGSFYKSPHDQVALSYLYWYFSGMIATWRWRLALDPSNHRREKGRLMGSPGLQPSSLQKSSIALGRR